MEANEKALFKELSRGRSIDHFAVKTLLNNGADVNARRDHGVTPLFLAAERGDMTVVQVLLEHGADLNVKSNWGSTVLMAAAYGLRPSTVEFLLFKGADATAVDEAGRGALEYSVEGCGDAFGLPLDYDPFPDQSKIEGMLNAAGAEDQDMDADGSLSAYSTLIGCFDADEEETTPQDRHAERIEHISRVIYSPPFVVSPRPRFSLPLAVIILALVALVIYAVTAP